MKMSHNQIDVWQTKRHEDCHPARKLVSRIANLVLTFTLAFFGFIVVEKAEAYPNFIGYSYTTCITCHYSSTGNGPLTDYGRALFSQEIAARPFISKRLSDDDLAQLSGFIPGVEIPRVRPYFKYRGLWIDNQPRSQTESVRFIHMQRDIGATLLLSSNQRTIFTASYGMLPMHMDYYGKGEKTDWVSREHYLRFYATRDLLVQFGLFDKTFGIKHEDHTAVNRSSLGLGMNDQSHGVLLHYFKQSWDVAAHVFMGNMLEIEKRRHKGASIMGEYELFEKNRIGASFLTSSSETNERMLIAIHDRWGLPQAQGSAIMVEAGLFQNKDKATAGATIGNYIWVQGLVSLARGYNLFTTVERRQNETKYTAPEIQRWTLGFLTYPWQRLEVRLNTVQTKTFSPEGAADDNWQIQGQVHVSL